MPFVQVGTYPTRNFATLGILVTPFPMSVAPDGAQGTWPDHFCLAPHVAMRIGLYLCRYPSSGTSRVVSEDPKISSIGRLRCLPLAFIE